MDNTRLQTVVETPEFIKQVKGLASQDAVNSFINYIAENPLEGSVIEGTGGARKIRWSKGFGKGKSGGMRVIYF